MSFYKKVLIHKTGKLVKKKKSFYSKLYHSALDYLTDKRIWVSSQERNSGHMVCFVFSLTFIFTEHHLRPT